MREKEGNGELKCAGMLACNKPCMAHLGSSGRRRECSGVRDPALTLRV